MRIRTGTVQEPGQGQDRIEQEWDQNGDWTKTRIRTAQEPEQEQISHRSRNGIE